MAKRGKVLHLMGWDKKFVPPFIAFVGEHFSKEEHRFIVHGPVMDGHLPQGQSVTHYPHLLKQLLPLMAEMRSARKIIIHGLFSSHLLYLLMLQPWILKKCYWTIWGGDLYIHQTSIKDWRHAKNEWCRRLVISRLGHFITQVRGDYELAQQWYGAKGQWHECFMYPSNVYHEYPITPTPHEGTNILLGNSASSSNNHLDALEKLRPFADENIRIYCPLSYGDPNYGDRIAVAGKAIFNDKFIPLREFMSFEKYQDLLAEIDIAVFNHNRQQGMGSATALLGMGKKLYLQKNTTQWVFFESMGIAVGNIADITLAPTLNIFGNVEKIKNYFSINKLVAQLELIFK